MTFYPTYAIYNILNLETGWREPLITHSPISAHRRVRKDKGTAKENEMKGLSVFFSSLRNNKWTLYVPERIYKAHQEGLLQGWGIAREAQSMNELLEILKQRGASIKVPYQPSQHAEWDVKATQEVYSSLIVIFEKDNPPLPEPVIYSDLFWDAFLEHFGLTGLSVTNKILAADGWAHQVRFFTLWVAVKNGWGRESVYDLPLAERRRISNANRVLRKEYGITSCYYENRRATLIVLKKAYPPEQVRRARRQLEEKLRKDPAEVIRYGLERGLVK